MESLRELFRYGMGPSSSHTMAPHRAASRFAEGHPDAPSFRVTLYGSLSQTGKGHLTDTAVVSGCAPRPCDIVWSPDSLDFHPNGMTFAALDETGTETDTWTVFSVGGGALREADSSADAAKSVYSQSSMEGCMQWAHETGQPLWQLVLEQEDNGIAGFLEQRWQEMQSAITRGLAAEGGLPGGLHLQRKAHSLQAKARRLRPSQARTGLISAYALAVAEENAAGGNVVTAPTCGSCGVVPAVLYYLAREGHESRESIVAALATAGLLGNIVKTNASISGAEVGCQGEIGAACAMAAAAAAQLLGGTPAQIEYAAETGLEHHLGLTCDPVAGLVQIPCIERNAFAATRALMCAEYALLSDGRHLVSFDQVVETMRNTGHDMPSLYRETARGGLAATLHQ